MSNRAYVVVDTAEVALKTEDALKTMSPDLADAPLEACQVSFVDPAKIARVRPGLIGARQVGALAETFRVLGDATRVRLLDALAAAELCVCDLAALLGVSESAVSHQLRLLRTMRLVRSRREGRMVFYALDDQHVVSLLRQGLEHVAEAAGAAPTAEAER